MNKMALAGLMLTVTGTALGETRQLTIFRQDSGYVGDAGDFGHLPILPVDNDVATNLQNVFRGGSRFLTCEATFDVTCSRTGCGGEALFIALQDLDPNTCTPF